MTQRAEEVVLEGESGPADAVLLQAALALSALAGTPFRFERLRAAEAAPGLDAPLLACVRAAAEVCRAQVDGAVPGSTALAFRPGSVRSGSWTLETAGAAAAVLHSVLLPLSAAPARSQLRLGGATHVGGAPTFHDLALGFLPEAERMGLGCELALESAAFDPEGAGLLSARVFPAPRLAGLEAMARGLLLEVRAIVLAANMPHAPAAELEQAVTERLRARGIAAEVEALPMPAVRGRGLGLLLAARFEQSRATWFAPVPAGGSPAAAADEAVGALQRFLGTRAALTPGLAAQLLLPAAVAASVHGARGSIGAGARPPSRFSVSEVTLDLLWQAHAVRRFLDVDVQIGGLPGQEGVVGVRPRA